MENESYWIRFCGIDAYRTQSSLRWLESEDESSESESAFLMYRSLARSTHWFARCGSFTAYQLDEVWTNAPTVGGTSRPLGSRAFYQERASMLTRHSGKCTEHSCSLQSSPDQGGLESDCVRCSSHSCCGTNNSEPNSKAAFRFSFVTEVVWLEVATV
jgi:hypothetical protein